MQLTMRTKFTYGLLILAFGMMLTDVCRLLNAPAGQASSAASGTQHARKF
jgi:hypothetical protein